VLASVWAEATPQNVSRNAYKGRQGTQRLCAAELEFTEEILFIIEPVRVA
jgi:hypothetical protein